MNNKARNFWLNCALIFFAFSIQAGKLYRAGKRRLEKVEGGKKVGAGNGRRGKKRWGKDGAGTGLFFGGIFFWPGKGNLPGEAMYT